jgi:outer membrane protein assembly factor BamB
VPLANPSVPTAGDGIVYVAAEAGSCPTTTGNCPAQIIALDETNGRVRWSVPEPAASRLAKLTLYDGVVYAGLRGTTQTLVALDSASGHELWRYSGRFPRFDAIITQQLVVAPDAAEDGNAALALFDRRTGASITPPALGGFVAALASDQEAIYLMLRDGRLIALDGRTAAIRWDVQTRFGAGYQSTQNTSIRLIPQPGALVVQAHPTDFTTSELEVYDTQTGARRWTAAFQLPDSEPPPAQDGLIYLRDISSTLLQAFDLKTGVRRWQYTVGQSTAPNPVLDGRQLLVASPKNGVVALDAASGAIIWGPLKIGVPSVAGGGAIYGVSEMSGIGFMPLSTGVYAYDSDSGKLRWSAEASGTIYQQQPIVTGTHVYLRTEKTLYALGR